MARLWVAGRVFVGRLRLMVRRDRLDDELRDEVRLHMDLRRQALIDGGMDPRQAEVEARRMFGNTMAIREETRDMWGFPSLDTLTQDIRYGARLLRRSPTVTIASILSLAIGIGASAGVFSLTDAMLFRSLPIRSPGELFVLQWHSGPTSPYASLSGYSGGNDAGERSTSFSLEAFRQARLQAHDAIDVIGFASLGQVNLSVNGVAGLGEATAVSGNYFDVLGLSPAQGRLLVDSDDRAEAFSAAVVSDRVWRTRFDGSPEATGRSLVINGVPFTVVGVAPPSFNGTGQVGSSPDVYVPLAANVHVFPDRGDPLDPNYWWVLMMGRLKPGLDPESARGRLDLIVKQTVRAARPELADKDLPRVEALPGAHGQLEERERLRDPLKLMSIVVGIVLLVACANVANLLLARGRARASELSVRIALGAPRRRIVRQLLTEGLILATIGSALGLLAARWIAGALLPALDVGFDPSLVGAGLNARLVAFVAVLASVCVVLFALVPALRTTDMSLTAGLHESVRGSAASHRRRGVSVTLVVAQITLSMSLVATALLLVRSVHQLGQVSPGFDPSHLLTFRLAPALNGYKAERVFEIYTTILERLRAAPGVQAASLSNYALISHGANIIVAARTDEPVVDRASAERSAFETTHLAWRMTVESRFFETMRIRINRGRTFDDRDSRTNQPMVVINRALAHQLFKTDDVVGRRFRVESRAGNPTYEIVGVCADALFSSLRESNPPTIYVPHRQQGVGAMTLEVRTAGDPLAFVPTAREIIRSVDANLPMLRVQTQEDQIAASVSRERLFATLATWLGAVALTLSAIGLYALLAYTVTLRTGEIGIRMALGANRRDVRWMIVRQSLIVAACGLGLGTAVSVAGTDLLRALLFNVEPRDSATLALSAALILVVTVSAGYMPARRASHVDPLTALRAE
jgi:predicted permease